MKVGTSLLVGCQGHLHSGKHTCFQRRRQREHLYLSTQALHTKGACGGHEQDDVVLQAQHVHQARECRAAFHELLEGLSQNCDSLERLEEISGAKTGHRQQARKSIEERAGSGTYLLRRVCTRRSAGTLLAARASANQPYLRQQFAAEGHCRYLAWQRASCQTVQTV
jgi:hypothetical protein